MSKGVYLTPSKYAILMFGGVRPLARLIGVKPNTVCSWQTRNEGAIPSSNFRLILDAAKKKGVDLTADDLVFGRTLTKNQIVEKRQEKNVHGRFKT